jgi:eukaryotic-like serine/threonine-protein kinase
VDVGDVVADKYEVRRVLEVGGRSTMLEAIERGTERFVVIELFRRFRVPHENERFLRELRSVATFKSDHAARVFGCGSQQDGTNYVITEPPEGDSLETLLRRQGPLPLVRVVELIVQACDAMHEAHAASVVHEDLSPETLFLSWLPDGTSCLKVRDFGARLATHAITEGRMFAMPRYTSPDQLPQSPAVDPRTDIWALGATMYELSSGHRPYEQAPAQLEAALLSTEPVHLRARRPGLPGPFSDAVMRCLARSPDARYPSVAELAEAISPFGPSRGQGTLGTVRGVLAAGATRLRSSTEIVRQMVRQRKP